MRGLAGDPLVALRQGGYVERISEERKAKNAGGGSSYA
jgi:L-rhamnose isomerase/sugar isomerase